uniref:Transcription factor HES-3 n=1 Tax=Pogona vitticeps TaxID=103695 RepID=A0ABM5EL29_9SAUR
MRTLHPPSQGLPTTKSADFQAGFRSCLQGVRQFLLRSDAARDLASFQLLHDLARALPLGLGGGFSTTDSGHRAAAAALPEPGLAPLGSPRAAAPPARGRARPLKPRPRGPREGEDSIPLRASWSQAPSGQDRLLQSGHPLWRPW